MRIHEDGSICVASGEGDLGQGSKTIIAQIVAEELGVAYESVQVAQLDTALPPGGIGCIASRTTVLAGNAARLAAQRARTLLIEAAADRWDCPPPEVRCT